MKPATLLLLASLLANAALIAFVALGSPTTGGPPTTAAAKPAAAGGDAQANALRAALASGDAAALQAAGVPLEIARELAIGRIFARLAERARAARAQTPTDDRWWRNRGNAPGAREQQLLVRRELSDALLAAFGDDLGLVGGNDGSLLSFLPAAKRDALRKIMQDYDEMFAKFGAGGVQLASDKEKLRLLRAERDRDIAALLTPEERAAYELRTSASAATVRARYGDAIQDEAEFRRIYELQKAFDEKFPREALTGRISPETLRARSEAERQLDADLRAAVGEDRYAALRRAADPDVRTVDALAARLNLASTATDSVLGARERFAAESQRISSDTSVPFPQRRAQIQELAAQAKTEITATLGADAADAYAQHSSWLGMLQSGMAYSTAPQPGAPPALFGERPGVYPVVPAGIAPANANRQVIYSAAGPAEAGAGIDAIAGGGGRMQVMSFTTATTSEPSGGDAGASTSSAAKRDAQGTPAPASPASQPKP